MNVPVLANSKRVGQLRKLVASHYRDVAYDRGYLPTCQLTVGQGVVTAAWFKKGSRLPMGPTNGWQP